MESRDAGRTGARGDQEPLRTAGFSPQGRPQPGEASCGLKSALRGRFMERDLFLLDLLRGHDPDRGRSPGRSGCEPSVPRVQELNAPWSS